ncbi:MAG: type II toxin-antitoxin system HicB family antitoxin [Gemmatimonadetes bacterium]|nr:type II toxin-antitoxin system HicB family antitoxin [Gemmatimonadota bacterium]
MPFTAVIEYCKNTGLYVGYVPDFPGAHSQGKTLDELNRNLKEVLEMLLEDGEPYLDTEFVGTQQIVTS